MIIYNRAMALVDVFDQSYRECLILIHLATIEHQRYLANLHDKWVATFQEKVDIFQPVDVIAQVHWSNK